VLLGGCAARWEQVIDPDLSPRFAANILGSTTNGVARGLLDSRANASTLLEPGDESLNDVSSGVCLIVEFDATLSTVLVYIGGNDWGNFARE